MGEGLVLEQVPGPDGDPGGLLLSQDGVGGRGAVLVPGHRDGASGGHLDTALGMGQCGAGPEALNAMLDQPGDVQSHVGQVGPGTSLVIGGQGRLE